MLERVLVDEGSWVRLLPNTYDCMYTTCRAYLAYLVFFDESSWEPLLAWLLRWRRILRNAKGGCVCVCVCVCMCVCVRARVCE